MNFSEIWSKHKGWFVVGAVCFNLIGLGGFIKSFGNLTQSLRDEFKSSEALTGQNSKIKHLSWFFFNIFLYLMLKIKFL